MFMDDKASLSTKRRLIQFVISKMEWDGEKIIFELKTPFDVIARASKNNNWGE